MGGQMGGGGMGGGMGGGGQMQGHQGQMPGQTVQSGQQSGQQMGMSDQQKGDYEQPSEIDMPEGRAADEGQPAKEGAPDVAMIAGAAISVIAMAVIVGLYCYKGCRSKTNAPPQTVSTSKGLGDSIPPVKQLQHLPNPRAEASLASPRTSAVPGPPSNAVEIRDALPSALV